MNIQEIYKHYCLRIEHYIQSGYNVVKRKDSGTLDKLQTGGVDILRAELEHNAGKRAYLTLSTVSSANRPLVPDDMSGETPSLVYMELEFPNSYTPNLLEYEVFYNISNRGRWYVDVPTMREIRDIRKSRKERKMVSYTRTFSTDGYLRCAVRAAGESSVLRGFDIGEVGYPVKVEYGGSSCYFVTVGRYKIIWCDGKRKERSWMGASKWTG